MPSNGLTIAAGTADLELTDGVSVMGFRLAANSKLREERGSKYAGQISSGGQTYADASPFKRKVYDSFIGGMGQTNDNKVNGGTGVGGDDTKYLYGDCKTDRGGYLLPGMVRNLVYNTMAGFTTPISDGLDPLGGDEYEVPRGVIPVINLMFWSFNRQFVASRNATVTGIRVLVSYRNALPYSDDITGNIYDSSLTSVGDYTGTSTSTDQKNMTGFKWVTLTLSAKTGAIVSGQTYTFAFVSGNLAVTAACYPQNATGLSGPSTNHINPYFQLMTTATPPKWWSTPLQKSEHINNGAGAYVNINLFNSSFVWGGTTGVVGSAAGSPERNYPSGTYRGSIWFNSKLYVFTTTGVFTMNFTQAVATGGLVPTDALSGAIIGSSPIEWGGFIYYVDAAGTGIARWNGSFAPAPVQVVADDTIGQRGTPINRLFVFQGNLWVIKQEGVFQLYADPSTITTAAGNLARINSIGDPFPSMHPDTGKWYVQHLGSFFFNYRDRIYQYTPSTSGPLQVTVMSLPMPWYRLSYYHYVNGIASDGVNLYASWNNLGVFQFINQVWHPVTEFYEQVGVEGQGSGLRWTPDPTTAPDAIFVGDGRTLVKIPVPSAAGAYTSQIFQNHQNKCGYLITSATDMEQSEIPKYVHSLIMRAVPSGFSYKVVAVVWRNNTTPSFNTLLLQSLEEGLSRDNWVAPATAAIRNGTDAVVTTKLSPPYPVANTLAPACWVAADFNNLYYSSEKLASTTTDTTVTPNTIDVLSKPPKFAKTAFILYFWNPVAGQHAATNIGSDLMAVDSLVVKYQAIQDYVALYRLHLSCSALTQGRAVNLDTITAEDTWDWLRSQFGRHSPIQLTLKVRNTGTTTRTLYAILQNPTDEFGNLIGNQDTNLPMPETVSFEAIGTVGEYPDV